MMKPFSVFVIAVLFTACNSAEPTDTKYGTAADLKIDLVNPTISGVPAVKHDSIVHPVTTKGAALLAVKSVNNKALIEKGAALIETSRCLSCHKLDIKFIGPAYKEVAKKYASTPANIAKLAAKVKAGGSGVWGEMPMPPNDFPDSDIKAMVTYILSLK